jgi:hypothetical protein
MSTPQYYLVETPEVSFTFIGTVQHDPLAPGLVWLCTPDGQQLLQCPAGYVTESTREQAAERIMADLRAHRARRN